MPWSRDRWPRRGDQLVEDAGACDIKIGDIVKSQNLLANNETELELELELALAQRIDAHPEYVAKY